MEGEDTVPTAYQDEVGEVGEEHWRGGTGLLSKLEPRRHHVRT